MISKFYFKIVNIFLESINKLIFFKSSGNSLPPKYRISADGLSLIINNLCKTCPDGKSDLTVIQCNASNVHGDVFGQGYVNILCAVASPRGGMGGSRPPTSVQTPPEICANPLKSVLYKEGGGCPVHVYCNFLLLTSKEKWFGPPTFFGLATPLLV